MVYQLYKLGCLNPNCLFIVYIPADMFDREFDLGDLQLCPACQLEELSFENILRITDFKVLEVN